MTAIIIPFPHAKEPIGSPERELAKLAALIHARVIREGGKSNYDDRLHDCERAAREAFADWGLR
ncbi:hypothetical protein H9L17_03365 [Thermomonas brevis]|jgi:hypothetical protein|uniref:Uncharacterized protein n=1 Tax=Thermomonas brevis TaxID=215691 RepID=A0A7G9QV30_9GAMM|nr:hypothetical protein [Thermomonas brevis]QNN47205.1 hypothetical protein H9L17_03365 [Thermomonas brevis]